LNATVGTHILQLDALWQYKSVTCGSRLMQVDLSAMLNDAEN